MVHADDIHIVFLLKRAICHNRANTHVTAAVRPNRILKETVRPPFCASFDFRVSRDEVFIQFINHTLQCMC